jgi:phosphoribosylanthranilate isomerase
MAVRIKICGVTRPADAKLVADFGADFIGLNFHRHSPRFISEGEAIDILCAIPTWLEAVGLFVRQPLDHVHEAASRLAIRTVQLHGEPRWMLPSAIQLRVIAAFPIQGTQSLDDITHYVEEHRSVVGTDPEAILVDAHVPGKHGGTGQTAPWHLLAGFNAGVPLILAGGLTPENVAEAIRIVRPWGVDVASGVESAPGKKDPEKLRRFIENARAAS